MKHVIVRLLASLLVLGIGANTASAEETLPYRRAPGDYDLVFLPPPANEPPPSDVAINVSPIIYLERCTNGCMVTPGTDDARGYTSSIPDMPSFIPEFENSAGETGAAANEEWSKIVKCVQEVYSPFNVQVTDVKPTAPTYHMDIVAGLARDVGLSNSIGGISPGVGCTPVDNRITYTFANGMGGGGDARVWEICGVIAQETAHTWGLDHSYSFPPNRSSCIDPMTYRGDCGGQKFFRNDLATCGEYEGRPCACGSTQNAHLKLLAVFGPGTPTTTPPTVTLTMPAAGTTTIGQGAVVIGRAHAQRGIKAVELWLNGWKWGQALGAQWGFNGQPETDYGIPIPSDVPDGVIDIVLKAKDDIDVTTETVAFTVTKGAPCASADSCLEGQKCEAGKCFWETPAGELGDECSYPEFCISNVCTGTVDKTICTRECVAGVADGCEEGFECIQQSPTKGVCWPKGAGDDGICSVSPSTNDRNAPVTLIVMMFGAVLVIARRRR